MCKIMYSYMYTHIYNVYTCKAVPASEFTNPAPYIHICIYIHMCIYIYIKVVS